MSAPLRAALLNGPLTVTAANLRTLDLVRELRERGIEVTVVAGPGELRERFGAAGIPVESTEITGAFLEDLPRLRALRRTVAKVDPHLIHITDPALLRAGSAVARSSGTPYLLSLDAVPARNLSSRFSLLRGILVPTRAVRDELVLWRRAPAEMIHILPPGIDLTRFPDLPTPFSGGRPVLCTVTPLPRQPGLEALLTAVRLLREREIQLHLVVAGHGPGDFALRGRIRDQGLTRDVTVTGMPLDLERVFAASDIYLRATRPGGFGAALLMAMAAGRPVVAEGHGPALTLVREGETGYLVPTGDTGRLVSRIARLIQSPDRALAFGAAGRRAVEEMGMAGPSEILEKLYREVVSVPAGRITGGA